MAATAKYLFDNDFGGGTAAKPVIALADHAAKIAQVEAEAYRNGYAAAEAKAQAEAKRDTAAMLAKIATGLDETRRRLSTLETRLEAEAIEIAIATARKLCAELIAREPFAELTALVGDCFRHLAGAPHVVVRVAEALYGEAQERLTAIARDRGFDGRLVVLAEPDIAPGDCRIEWADGGVTRNRAVIDSAVDELVTRYIAARQSGAAMPPSAISQQQQQSEGLPR
jgi:flagellar assembly protein FliH